MHRKNSGRKYFEIVKLVWIQLYSTLLATNYPTTIKFQMQHSLQICQVSKWNFRVISFLHDTSAANPINLMKKWPLTVFSSDAPIFRPTPSLAGSRFAHRRGQQPPSQKGANPHHRRAIIQKFLAIYPIYLIYSTKIEDNWFRRWRSWYVPLYSPKKQTCFSSDLRPFWVQMMFGN